MDMAKDKPPEGSRMSAISPVQGSTPAQQIAPQAAPEQAEEAAESATQEAAEGGAEPGKGAKVDTRA
jgi:hypothetical protein